MSRSYRKTSITGNTKSTSEKWGKKFANKKFRRLNKVLISDPRRPLYDKLNEVYNKWLMEKDGKHYFNSDEYPEHMRK